MGQLREKNMVGDENVWQKTLIEPTWLMRYEDTSNIVQQCGDVGTSISGVLSGYWTLNRHENKILLICVENTALATSNVTQKYTSTILHILEVYSTHFLVILGMVSDLLCNINRY